MLNDTGIPPLTIGKVTARIPIIQGGMAVRVSMAGLASAVANAGGIGTIASTGLGDLTRSIRDFEGAGRQALIEEIRKAREKTRGPLAVNFMGAVTKVDTLVRAAVEEGVPNIVYGAGLPLNLPAVVEEGAANLVPIVSSARVAQLILKKWDRGFNRIPEAFILEGPLAGGHLGFSVEQLMEPEKCALDILLPDLLKALRPFEDKHGRKIPVITGGGIFDGRDIARMFALGASGVQMATRFVCTHECDVDGRFKQAYLEARREDVWIIKSPVGLPGRAIRNPFLEEIESGVRMPFSCPYKCLVSCGVEKAQYCIAEALVKACRGDVENGLIFCGANVYRVDRIVSVQELMDELVAGFLEAQVPMTARA
jgi:nitronate monooxygenase